MILFYTLIHLYEEGKNQNSWKSDNTKENEVLKLVRIKAIEMGNNDLKYYSVHFSYCFHELLNVQIECKYYLFFIYDVNYKFSCR